MKGAFIRFNVTAWVILAVASAVCAQVSDFEVVENFKQTYRKLENAMAAENDPERLDRIGGRVQALKKRYRAHEKLIDTALYPETFVSVFNRLQKDWTTRKRAAVERSQRIRREEALAAREKQLVAELNEKTAENERLRQELNRIARDVDRLSSESAALREQIRSLRAELKSGTGTIDSLKAESKKDQETIERIKELAESLKAGLASRDRLLADMKDNLRARDAVVAAMGKKLLAGFSKPRITPAETQALGVGIRESDYFGAVMDSVEENIRFLESTFLTPGDLEFARSEHLAFEEMWQTVGPPLAQAYPGDGAAAEDLDRIQYALDQWSSAIDTAAWRNLQTVFTQHDFHIGGFKNGTELRDRLISFVYDEKKIRGRENYARFKQEVWDAEVKSLWIPYLEAQDKFDASQVADVQAVLDDWGKRTYTLYWLIGLGLLLAASVTILLVKRK